MDREEVKALIKDIVGNFIKDEPDAAQKNFHDVLSAKMRDRVNPQPSEEELAAAAEAEAGDPDEAGEIEDPAVAEKD